MAELEGRVALITGGGRGIGRAIAVALARQGADVAICGRSQPQLEETAQAVRSAGGRAEAVGCDVTDRQQVDGMFGRVMESLGDPLILVNNAGIAVSAKLTATTDEMWDSVMRTNATSAFWCMKAVMPKMLDAGWGRIVNIASIAARAGAPYLTAYAASKHALLGLTRAVAAEVASRGITVNAICPGYVDTEMTDRSTAYISARTGRSEDVARKLLEGVSPQGRLMTVDEVAGLASYLCLDVARGITGQGLVLDGGSVQA
jgi:NAD(P)-dependent dehydrogenase (short-subunit alcohol dehydrogenase family)